MSHQQQAVISKEQTTHAEEDGFERERSTPIRQP